MGYRISKFEDEVYFVNMRKWEEFDLISNVLEKIFKITIIEKLEGVAFRSYKYRVNGMSFYLRHDEQIGNYFKVSFEDIPIFEDIAKQILNNIIEMLEEKS